MTDDVTKLPKNQKLPEIKIYLHNKNPTPKPPSWKTKRGNNSSKTQQYLEKTDKKKNRQRREARQRFVVHPTGFEPVAF